MASLGGPDLACGPEVANPCFKHSQPAIGASERNARAHLVLHLAVPLLHLVLVVRDLPVLGVRVVGGPIQVHLRAVQVFLQLLDRVRLAQGRLGEIAIEKSNGRTAFSTLLIFSLTPNSVNTNELDSLPTLAWVAL